MLFIIHVIIIMKLKWKSSVTTTPPLLHYTPLILELIQNDATHMETKPTFWRPEPNLANSTNILEFNS